MLGLETKAWANLAKENNPDFVVKVHAYIKHHKPQLLFYEQEAKEKHVSYFRAGKRD